MEPLKCTIINRQCNKSYNKYFQLPNFRLAQNAKCPAKNTPLKLHVHANDTTTPNIVERPSNVGNGHIRGHVAKHLTDFKLCTTTPNNIQQHATVYANRHNM